MVGFFEDTVADNVKIRYAWTPEPWSGAGYLLVLAVGAMFSWAVVYVTVLLAVVAIFGSFDRDPMAYMYGFAAMIGVVGAIGFPWGLSPFRYRRAIRHRPFRRARLDRLAMQDDVRRRLPHRMVEQALFMRTGTRQQIKWLLRKLKRGDTILLNWPRGDGVSRPTANEVPFEPIDVGDDHERVKWLILLNVQEQGAGRIQDIFEQEDDTSPHIWESLKSAFWVLLMLAAVGYIIHQLVTAGGFSPYLLLVLILGGFLEHRFKPLLAEQKWWLVPGGMICRESRIWRKGHRAALITPVQSPLVVDMRSGMGFLLHGQAIRSFACPQWTAWAVAAGWMSRARTPTMEEVRAFLLTSE